jgi:hypothetical protein
MKQSSIEWLIDNLYLINSTQWNDIIEQAKSMHKEEIENAYWDGGQQVPMRGSQCEEYYNETFNTKEK